MAVPTLLSKRERPKRADQAAGERVAVRAGAAEENAPEASDRHASKPLRVLQIARVCHPHESMESRIGWYRAVHAARRHHVTLLHGSLADEADLKLEAERFGVADRIEFVPIEAGPLGQWLSTSATTYYAGYRLWHRAVFAEAKRRHRRRPFDLVHQTTYSGFREPGLGWRLGAPFVWGPVGGTQAFPMSYLTQLGPKTAWIELVRNLINAWQLRFSPHVRGAFRQARVVVAATQRAQHDLARAGLGRFPVQLETALDEPVGPHRADRRPGEPLRILWSGRLRAWKTLPLLLRALPLLAEDVDWRLRVLGVGRSERAWRRLADRLGIADRIEWLGWPGYRDTLPHYKWADAFAFTSMRDTSGTGLLEALSAGTPIVGVNHQGAADLYTADCALPVPVSGPQDSIRGFATALTTLQRDPALWRRLSDGARKRAADLHWGAQADTLLDWYEAATAPQQATAKHEHGAAAATRKSGASFHGMNAAPTA